MASLQTYLNILDKIHDLSSSDTTNSQQVFETIRNTEDFNKFLKHYACPVDDSSSSDWKSTLLAYFTLSKIHTECQNQPDLLSVNQQNTFCNVFETTTQFALERCLPKTFHLLAIKKIAIAITDESCTPEITNQIFTINTILTDLFDMTLLSSNALLENVVIQYVVAVFFCLYTFQKSSGMNDRIVDECEKQLKKISLTFGAVNTFRFYLIVKGMHHLPKEISVRVHKELVKQLRKPGGFGIFCRILLAHDENPDNPNWERYQSIAKIVGAKGYTKSFYSFIVKEIVQFLHHSLANESDLKFSQPCVVSLKQIYSLGIEEVGKDLLVLLFQTFDELVIPTDVISGVILVDGDQFHRTLQSLCAIFNGSIDKSTFPSTLLVPYVPLLFQILVLLQPVDTANEDKKYISHLLCSCLHNRKDNELVQVLQTLLFQSKDNQNQTRKLHPRIEVKAAATYRFQIAADLREPYNLYTSVIFVEMLKNSGNNLLMYKIFISLLKILQLQMSEDEKEAPPAVDLLCHEDDDAALQERVNSLFYNRTIVVKSICDLLSFKQFHSQFKENPKDIIDFGERILRHNIERLKRNTADAEDCITDIVLTIFNEFFDLLKTSPSIVRTLKEYQRLNKNERIKMQLDRLLETVEGGGDTERQWNINSETAFAKAMSLCADKTAPVKVEGIFEMIKLLNAHDEETVAFRHKVLALTLDNLKDVESYVYLNSILLLVALTKVMEAEVVESLVDEFTNNDSDTEFRLKVGEVLVKVLESMGPLSYNYKDLLINTFLKNCQRPYPVEFRTSCTVNLGTVAQILSYQVHTYFYELMSYIENVLAHEQYVPLRRAAVLMLSQLLSGMDKLVDLGDHVLEVYRLLKHIVQTETDEKTNLHASIALETLKIKTNDFLKPEMKLEKEIKVMGLGEPGSNEIRYK